MCDASGKPDANCGDASDAVSLASVSAPGQKLPKLFLLTYTYISAHIITEISANGYNRGINVYNSSKGLDS